MIHKNVFIGAQDIEMACMHTCMVHPWDVCERVKDVWRCGDVAFGTKDASIVVTSRSVYASWSQWPYSLLLVHITFRQSYVCSMFTILPTTYEWHIPYAPPPSTTTTAATTPAICIPSIYTRSILTCVLCCVLQVRCVLAPSVVNFYISIPIYIYIYAKLAVHTALKYRWSMVWLLTANRQPNILNIKTF